MLSGLELVHHHFVFSAKPVSTERITVQVTQVSMYAPYSYAPMFAARCIPGGFLRGASYFF
jgi:hypothetical protein